MVYSASAIPASQSARLGHDEFYYLKRQLVARPGSASGSSSLALRLGHARASRALAYPLLGVTRPPRSCSSRSSARRAGGAQRWIPLGPLQFQPAEVAKVALVLYLARSLARKRREGPRSSRSASSRTCSSTGALVGAVPVAERLRHRRHPRSSCSSRCSSRRARGSRTSSAPRLLALPVACHAREVDAVPHASACCAFLDPSATATAPASSSGSRCSAPRTAAGSARGSARARGSSSTCRRRTPTSSSRSSPRRPGSLGIAAARRALRASSCGAACARRSRVGRRSAATRRSA